MRVLLLLLTLPLAACLDWPEDLLKPDSSTGDIKVDQARDKGPVKEAGKDVGEDKTKPDIDKDAPGQDLTKDQTVKDQTVKDQTVKDQTVKDQTVLPKDQLVPPPKDQLVPPKDQFVPPKDQLVPPPKDQLVPPPKDQTVKDQTVPPKDQAIVTLKNNGVTCGGPGECYSGHCFDGVCCDRTCAGSCFTCNASGKAGQCVPVTWGDKPPTGKSCATTLSDTCGTDGTCDGAGQCKKWSGTSCQKASCDKSDATKVVLPWHCDGLGACVDLKSLVSPIDCKTYACHSSGPACNTSCKTKNQCAPGKTCVGGKCDGKALPMGATCSSGGQCESGKCTEGVCCDSDCTDPCKTCVRSGAGGRCSPVAFGVKPSGTKSCPSNAPCGEDSRCDGKGKCRVAPMGAACGSTACVVDKVGFILKTFACDGKGKCAEAQTSCGAFACQPGAKSCYGRCTGNTHCVTGKSCSVQHCS